MITLTPNSEAPDVVHDILTEAVSLHATDIYWLPDADSVRVNIRVNGVQKDLAKLPLTLGEQCLTHIKVLGGLLTYRTSVAQDGVIRWGEPPIEMRVASMPTYHGERLTLRLMTNDNTPDYLDELGLQPHILETVKKMVMRPNGMIILTGPTGCGKSTTIYAMIRELIKADQDPSSIISLEDPIERVIDGISQVSVRSEDENWNYQSALKAALRQDVKTLVVGEMRDRHIVKVVLDAALTGHRVITTYHAGDIPSVYARLLHQGFEPFLVATAISGVVSQRLVADDDQGLLPVAAALDPDDSWRELICSTPHLGQLRKEISKHEGADIRAEAKRLLDNGTLTRKQAGLITGI